MLAAYPRAITGVHFMQEVVETDRGESELHNQCWYDKLWLSLTIRNSQSSRYYAVAPAAKFSETSFPALLLQRTQVFPASFFCGQT